jgi:hypothetical protein
MEEELNEKRDIFDLDNQYIGTLSKREIEDTILRQWQDTGKIQIKVRTVRGLVLNAAGEITIQRRSYLKRDNPSLWDKSLGGHVKAGQGPKPTLIDEANRELDFSVAPLTRKDFRDTLLYRLSDLKRQGIATLLCYNPNFISKRVVVDHDSHKVIGVMEQPLMNYLFIIYYDGWSKFQDQESIGVQTLPIWFLKNEMTDRPNDFSNDLHVLIHNYGRYLVPLDQQPLLGLKKNG